MYANVMYMNCVTLYTLTFYFYLYYIYIYITYKTQSKEMFSMFYEENILLINLIEY